MGTLSHAWLRATMLAIVWMSSHQLDVTFHGRERIVHQPNRILAFSHISALDPFVLGSLCTMPEANTNAALLPWSIAEEKWFYRLPITRQMFLGWQCILIHRNSGDFGDRIEDIATITRNGTLIMFPEGTRNRNPLPGQLAIKTKSDGSPLLGQDGKPLVRWRRGVVELARRTGSIVYPIGHAGMDDVLKVGEIFPRLNHQRITIVVGEPVNFSNPAIIALDQKTQNALLQQRLALAHYEAHLRHTDVRV